MYLALYALWLILNGRLTMEICLIGVPVTIAVGLLASKALHFSFKRDLHFARNAYLGLAFAAVLISEIFKANIRMVQIVLNKNIPVHQTLLHMDVDLKTDGAKALLANAITLTPGTITVSVEGNHFIVHCLSREMMDGIGESALMNLLRKMESKA